MVQVSYPGVYVQEVPSGARAITGVATSIAAIVGMAQRGPVNQPIQILSFADYERVFSSDTSAGEMTDQVRQFFLNGGQRAYIVRVADDAQASQRTFGTAGASFTLVSLGMGTDENQIRVRVDYDTSAPGTTFNLTVYRESFDSAGNATVSDLEKHSGLSLSANSPYFVKKVLERDSRLVSIPGDVTVPAPAAGRSWSGRVAETEAAMVAVLDDLLDLTVRPFGAFTLTVEGHPSRTVQVPSGTADSKAALVAAVEDAFADLAVTVTGSIEPIWGGSRVVIQVTSPNGAVRLGSAAQNDIAAALGLGVDNGGYEVGPYVASRPLPSGLVFSDDLEGIAESDRGAFFAGTPIVLSGPEGFSLSLGDFEFPDGKTGTGTSEMLVGSKDGLHLANVRENLGAVAAFINRSQSKWLAELQGFRLSLRPLFGNFSTKAAANLTGPGFIGSVAQVRSAAADNLEGALPGSLARLVQYQQAFQTIDKNVDLFNLLILPRSADDTDGAARGEVWGPASSFCFEKRAFLLVDADPNLKDVAKVPNAVRQLRIGMKKDHAAFYWPRVQISSGGERKLIDPSGTIAGLMARTDASRGVWKAPAGVEAELLGTLGVETRMSDRENGTLNPEAINCIRTFPNGIISWGARTMDGFDNSGNLDYKYVPVRRLSLFIAESLQRGLKFAVFEPNDEPLWAQIRLAAGGFMNNLFRQGAFQGSTARDAYFVKVDRETTTQNDINLGIVNVAVGFAPLRPAEFVVVTLQQKAGQIQI